MKKLKLLLIGLFLFSAGAASASQWPITYELNGLLSGDYNGTAFTGKNFEIHLTANAMDVTPVTTFDPSSPGDLYVAGALPPFHQGPPVNGSLSINDVGIFTFINNLYASDSQLNNLQPGIFEIGTDLEAAFISITDRYFASYKMMTSVPSFPVIVSQIGYSSFAVSRAGGSDGVLNVVDASSLTFQAEGGVPEPSTLLLLGAGVTGLLFMKKKCRY